MRLPWKRIVQPDTDDPMYWINRLLRYEANLGIGTLAFLEHIGRKNTRAIAQNIAMAAGLGNIPRTERGKRREDYRLLHGRYPEDEG